MHINNFMYCFYLSLNDFKDVVICCHSIFVQYENVHETSCEQFLEGNKGEWFLKKLH